jgi:hypothetical protein
VHELASLIVAIASGFKSAVGAVHLSLRELAGHGALFGGPGSGKTTLLQLLVEDAAGQQSVIIVDPKGSPALAETVRAYGGQVWTFDGRLPADLLDPRPWQVPDVLLVDRALLPQVPAGHGLAARVPVRAQPRTPNVCKRSSEKPGLPTSHGRATVVSRSDELSGRACRSTSG